MIGSIVRRTATAIIQFYQTFISPLSPPSCRYHPTCSNYAIDSINRHGLFKGFILSFWRILRCNPFSRGGYDPAPPLKTLISRKTVPKPPCTEGTLQGNQNGFQRS